MEPTTNAVASQIPESFVGLFQQVFQQIAHTPGALLAILVVGALAYCLEIWPKFPSQWIGPICIVLLGPAVFTAFVISLSTSLHISHVPVVILMGTGSLGGLLAFLFHMTAIRWAINRWGLGVPPQPPEQKQ